MKEMTFSLAVECDPAFRVAIHGLRLACLHGRSKLYPGIPGPQELTWDIAGDTITIRYSDKEVLSRFMDAVWGECPKGYIVPPGYTSDENSIGIYRTVQAHSGLTRHFRSSNTKGQAIIPQRVYALNKDCTPFAESLFKDIRLSYSVGTLLARAGKGDEGDKTVSWHVIPLVTRNAIQVVKEAKKTEGAEDAGGAEDATVETPVQVDEDAVEITVMVKDKPKTLTLKMIPRKPLTPQSNPTALHAGYGIWNNENASLSPERVFLLSFAGLAHAHVGLRSDAGYGGLSLGLDADSFEEFDRWFSLCVEVSQRAFLVQFAGSDPEVAASLLAASLRLPVDRAYPVVYSLPNQGAVSTYFTFSPDKKYLAEVFDKAGMHPLDREGFLKVLEDAPILRRGAQTVSAYDLVMENRGFGVPWYKGFHALSEWDIRFKDAFPGTFWKIQRMLAVLEALIPNEGKELEMEQQIRRKMNWLVYRIKKGYMEGNVDPDRAAKLAFDFVVKSNLKGVSTRRTLLAALNRIVEKAGGFPGFTEEEMACLEGMSPLLARDTLIVGAYMTKYAIPGTKAEDPGAVATEDTTPISDYEVTDINKM